MAFFNKPQEGDNQPPRNPNNLVTFRVVAIGYVIYLCINMVKLYMEGGPDVPSLPLLIGGLAFLGGGAVFMAVISYKEWKRNKVAYDAYMAELQEEAEAKRAAEEAAEAEEEEDYLLEEAEETEE